jgi:hypothetical protein
VLVVLLLLLLLLLLLCLLLLWLVLWWLPGFQTAFQGSYVAVAGLVASCMLRIVGFHGHGLKVNDSHPAGAEGAPTRVAMKASGMPC